jgi:hypothetical protein
MNDGDGIVTTLRQVAEVGKANGWHWKERYYSAKTGNLAEWEINKYIEYATCLVRIVNEYLLGIRMESDSTLSIAPTVPAAYWQAGFGHTLRWAGRVLTFRCCNGTVSGHYDGPSPHGTRGTRFSEPPNGCRRV